MEDCRVVELRHRGEPAEFSGELHEGEIPPAKGEGTGCELHRREGESVHLSGSVVMSHPTEIQDIIKHNFYYTEDCEIYFHDFSKTFCVYLFLQIDTGLEIAVLKFHYFSGFLCPYKPRM